jgi:uncharacterized protein (UPF0548 family)
LAAAARLGRNFEAAQSAMTRANGWSHYYSESVVARESAGPPEAAGAFERARVALIGYQFSDPAIVAGHFDGAAPLLGRRMLLEIKALGLHYLSAVVVAAVRDDRAEGRATFGYRYDTLEGHIERGSEWFLLTKDEATGEIRFRVDASWRPGDLPNVWSRAGFELLAPRYQERWHHSAHGRLFLLAHHGRLTTPRPGAGRLVHAGPDVVFESLPARRRT